MSWLPALDDPTRRELLALARETLELYLTSRPTGVYVPRSPSLAEPRGAFVSLHRGDELRGCVGRIFAEAPLFETVRECVVSAAVDDDRFACVRREELPEIQIEISVLSPLRRIERPELVEVGTHGLFLSRGRCRGLLLPQVATDHGWDREMFLAQTCRKAGLPLDAWRDAGTEIEVFMAEVFSDGPGL